MAKHKAGLHKEITSIFDGVPLQKKKDARKPTRVPAKNRLGNEAQRKDSDGPLEAPVSTKPPAPAPEIPRTPKPQRPGPLLRKVVPAEQPKVDTAVENAAKPSWQQVLEQFKSKLFAPKPGVNAGRQKVMTILIPVLFIILIFVFIKVLSPPVRGTHPFTASVPSNAVAGSGNKIDLQIPALYPATLRDPMRFGSATTAQVETGKLTVTGIVHSRERPCAIIDNLIVREGDKVSGAIVVKINKDSVELEMNGKRWTQRVQQ